MGATVGAGAPVAFSPELRGLLSPEQMAMLGTRRPEQLSFIPGRGSSTPLPDVMKLFGTVDVCAVRWVCATAADRDFLVQHGIKARAIVLAYGRKGLNPRHLTGDRRAAILSHLGTTLPKMP